MSLKKKSISGIFWSLIQQFSTQSISLVVSIVLSRLLVPEQFGLIAMLGIFMGLGTIMLESGLGQSLIRTENPDIEDYSTVFYFNLGGSLLVYVIVYFCAPFISVFYHQPQLEIVTRYYCLIFITNAFSSIHYTKFTKQMQFKKELTITLPSLVLSSIVGITMAYSGYGVWSLVVSGLTQSFAVALQMWIRSDWTPVLSFNKEKFKYHFQYGYKLTLSGILDTLFNNAYVIIIGKFFAPVQVGFYNRADTLKQFPVNNISTVLNKVTFPLFAEIKNDNDRLKEINRKIMKMALFIASPILLIMCALAEPLFRFLFTEKWLPAVPYFQILCWSGVLYPIHDYNLNILKVKGRSDLFLKLEIIKKIMVVIVITISLTYGIYGLLYGGIIVSVLAFFVNTYYSGKYIDYTSWHQTKDIVPTIFLATVAGATVYLVDSYLKQFGIFDILRLIIGTAIGVILFLLLSVFFKLSALSEIINIIKKQ